MKKIIHRIFFNFDDGEDPFLSYLETWKKELPDFEIMNWDKSNLPLDLNEFTRLMTAEKNHAFLSDYFRCWLLKRHGGVYLDADIEILNGAVFRGIYEEAQAASDYSLFIGIESRGNGQLTAHSMGLRCGATHEILDFLLNLYETAFSGPLHYCIRNFNIPYLMTLYFLDKEKKDKYTLSGNGRFSAQDTALITYGMKIYPQVYFSPVTQRGDGKIVSAFGSETCLCHHFAATWIEGSGGEMQAKLFAANVRDGGYAIGMEISRALATRGYALPAKLQKPKWNLTEKQIAFLENVLNTAIPYGSLLYKILKRKP